VGGGADLAPGECRDLLLLDVTPLSLGIELEGSQMSTLIKRNTAIPCRKTRTYTTVADFQTDIDVVRPQGACLPRHTTHRWPLGPSFLVPPLMLLLRRLLLLNSPQKTKQTQVIFEGERPLTHQNNKLGEFVISGVERAKAGVPQVEVTFALDANGILTVSAEDSVTGAKATAEIKADRGRLTEDEIERMISEAERYRAADEALASKVSLRNACEEACFASLSAAKDKKDAGAIAELNEVRDWLELDSDEASLEALTTRAALLNERYGAKIALP